MARLEIERTESGAHRRAIASARQKSLRSSVSLDGLGVHSGKPARVTIHPAEAGAGVSLMRGDAAGEPMAQAHWSNVCSTELCTGLALDDRHAVSTVEHVLAALFGLGVDNALIEVDGPEIPVLDGSSADFVAAIEEAGVVGLGAPRRFIEVLKTVRVERGGAFAELSPASGGLSLDVEIQFDHAAIGRQRKALKLDAATFRREIARARTFGFLKDIERLWRGGFALGASLENSIALAEQGVVNPEGLRFPDEFVRHKMLDAVGDLALAGAPLIGAFRSRCGGHALNHAVLQALFADSSAWRFTQAPLRRGETRPDIGAIVQPALAPDRS